MSLVEIQLCSLHELYEWHDTRYVAPYTPVALFLQPEKALSEELRVRLVAAVAAEGEGEVEVARLR